jgi:hypothetical protein
MADAVQIRKLTTLGVVTAGLATVLAVGGAVPVQTSLADAYWTAEICNLSLEDSLDNIDESQTKIEAIRVTMEAAQRRGDSADVGQQKKSLESYQTIGIAGNLNYIDNDLLQHCDRSLLRPDLVARIEPARKLLEAAPDQTFAPDPMPDLQVTGVTSTFVPYLVDDKGRCSGPYMDLQFDVMNRGGDYPRPVDLKTNRERIKDAAEKMHFFTIIAALDFGNGVTGHEQISVDRSMIKADGLPSTGSASVPFRLRVLDNQLRVRISAKIQGGLFLKVSNDQNESAAYDTAIDIPIWDVYTQDSIASNPSLDQGYRTFRSLTTIVNLGKTATPGPVEAHLALHHGKANAVAEAWTGRTTGPVSPDVNGSIFVDRPLSVVLEEGNRSTDSSLILLCPDGTYGSLADGNKDNNFRTLTQSKPAEQVPQIGPQ